MGFGQQKQGDKTVGMSLEAKNREATNFGQTGGYAVELVKQASAASCPSTVGKEARKYVINVRFRSQLSTTLYQSLITMDK
jgi:hypothetical protein